MNLEETKYHVDFGEYYVRMTDKQKHYLVVRSVIDRILAGIALVILSPLFLIVSIAQKISAPDEPVFFLQKRVGKNAHCFNIIKFRTMKSSAPKNVATGDLADPQIYISRLGRFLRDTSIDELPQFVNVVKGEMSLIGITGWAQVNGRDTVDIYDKVYYDREYVQNVSLKFDLKVIWKSVLVVLGRKGVVDGKVDPEFRQESIVLLRESQLVQNRQVECTDENKLPMM